MKNYSNSPDKRFLKIRKQYLMGYKKYFEKIGVKLIFFEMPMHERLIKSNLIKSTHGLIQDVFPSGKYIFLNSPDCSKFSTTDGLHLDQKSISLYTTYLS